MTKIKVIIESGEWYCQALHTYVISYFRNSDFADFSSFPQDPSGPSGKAFFFCTNLLREDNFEELKYS